MRTNRLQYYSAIIASGRDGVPSIQEARSDLDRAFVAVRFGSLAS